MQRVEGNFHNYLSYDRRYLDVEGSDDCLGRALWSLGCVVNSALPNDLRLVSKEIFDRGFPWAQKSTSVRCFAYTILGLCEYYRVYHTNNLTDSIVNLTGNMIKSYEHESRDDWRWFESHLTYDNARLPEALFEAYSITGNGAYLKTAEESMGFLVDTQIIKDKFIPIGNNGWFTRGGKRAMYDQQPLEACAMVEASVDAFYAIKDKRYLKLAGKVFDWFLGKNTNRVMVYNSINAGCFDGITPTEVNRNQGGESSISYLLARLKLEELKQKPTRQVIEFFDGISK
jgi:hypothetical protein